MHESDLLPPLARHFEALGFRVFAEVAVTGRRADLVAVADDTLVAVELKLARWREAIRQAVAYQVWAPRAYVALPFPRAIRTARHRSRFEAEGIGLLAVLEGDVRTFWPATVSRRLFPALADHVRARLARPTVPLDAFPIGERFYGDSGM
ncbi:MAG: hypothetical protein AABY30_05630 [Candidatus Thermoplasmatota archaeon]